MTASNFFIVLVPGYMGSKLRDRRTGQIIWLDIPSLLRDIFQIDDNLKHMFESMRYPNDNLEPAGIVEDVLFLPPLFKSEQYGRLLAALQNYGCSKPDQPVSGKIPLYTFAYDWRQDNRISARQLAARVHGWRAAHHGAKAWLVGHSNGGIVSRWYIEKEGGKDDVERLFLMGSPWDGAPKALQVLLDGLDIFLTRLFSASLDINALTRQTILSFPSFYQLVPHHYEFLRDTSGKKIDPFKDLSWLENDRQRQMLLDARKFNQDLGTTLSVDSLCFFGDKQLTTSRGVVQKAAGKWQKITWQQTERGDGTVPLPSAIHPNAREKLPFLASHGDIYIVPPVLEKLAFEINPPQFPAPLGVVALSGGYKITFEPEQDAVDPGSSLGVWATIADAASEKPVRKATITIRMELAQALPSLIAAPVPLPVEITLEESRQPGRYIGLLTAPGVQGYYRLVCTIQAGPSAPVTVEELVLVDSSAPPPTTPPPGPPGDLSGWGGLPPSQPGTPDVMRGWEPGQDATPKGVAGEPPVFRTWDPTTAPTAGGLPGAQPLAAGVEQPTGGERFINAEFTEHDMRQPLPVDRESTMAIFVDTQASAFAPSIKFDDSRLFLEDEAVIQLEIYLTSRDFIIHTKGPQVLRVPAGARPSRNKARFDIEPRKKQPGVGEVTALIFKDKNFVQGAVFKLNVGSGSQAIASAEILGRPPDGAAVLQPRDVTLFIKKAVDGYDLTLVREAVTEARLPISALELNQLVKEARKALLDVVHFRVGNSLPYQLAEMTIPPEVSQKTLKVLARAGWKLYRGIFFGPRAGADAQLLGVRLLELAEAGQLKLQIISQDFMLPWGLLYMATDVSADAPLDWQRFLGLKHIIEHIPLQTSMPVYENKIPSQPRLTVSLNVDPSVDRPQFPVVGNQLAWWQETKKDTRLEVIERKNSQDFVQALASETAPDQIIYFYGHAVSKQLEEGAGPGSSSLSFPGGGVTLDDLSFDAPATRLLKNNPLVFINACESAELSPLFYGGFMPYFTQKGARGMIGTECEAPALFAAEWAKRFFERFLFEEKTVGEVFLELRREFYAQHNNILGLIYALYCDGDTRITPGM